MQRLIMDHKEYLKDAGYLRGISSSDANSISKLEKALNFAHDIRKFEIDLYWKRATYFWTLIAAILGAWLLILNAKEADLDPLAKNLRLPIMQVLAGVGFLFSLGWFFVNKASKFWQRNWELQVDLLENPITGDLYKRVHSKVSDSAWKPHTAYPYSVSNINQMLSAMVMIVMLSAQMVILPWKCIATNQEWMQVGVFVCTIVFAIYMSLFGKMASIRGNDKFSFDTHSRFSKRTITTEQM
jgi:hypothetical protein